MVFVEDIPNYEEELIRLSKTQELDLSKVLNDIFRTIFNVNIPPEILQVLQIIMWVAIIAFVLWLIVKEFGLLDFKESKENEDIYEYNGPAMGSAEDADIRGHNFSKELQEALNSGDFALAVHLRYLMTLQYLDSQKIIVWKPFKTPLMYVAEIKKDVEMLKNITLTFLYIKYGHYPANEAVYNEVTDIYNTLCKIRKGGNDE